MEKPTWWSRDSDIAWQRVKEALRRDWDQTKYDLRLGGHELNQKMKDTVAQASGDQPLPASDRPNPPRVLMTWEEAAMPIGYGYAARTFFGDSYPEWNDELERLLERDWKADPPWPTVKNLVRHGYEVRR
jgi:hypothetical protein